MKRRNNPEGRVAKFVRKFTEKRFFSRATPEEAFTYIYRNNKWQDNESRSGTGSNSSQTETLRSALPGLCEELELNSLLDIPCGDFYWMQMIHLPVSDYLGADIVPELIEENQRLYAREGVQFRTLDLIGDPLPAYDAILCRDCLVHLSFADLDRAIRNMLESGANYLMATSHTGQQENRDQLTGKHRLLNLQLPPFNWPAPLREIPDGWNDESVKETGKILGVWRIGDIKPLTIDAVR